MVNLTDWANAVAGRYIDVDRWEGNQCWDLSQHWLTSCNGGTLWTQPSNFPGMAAGSWEVATGNTANTADLLRHVTAHPGTERGLPGDIVIFAYGSPAYPISHTAVLIEDRGPILRTLSQNSSPSRPDLPGYSVKSSGPTIYQDLTRAGILGFLRPRTTITGQGSGYETIAQEDTLSAAEVQEIKVFTQTVINERSDVIIAEIRANAAAVGDTVRAETYGVKVFAQQVINERSDVIILDARAQIAGLGEVVKQLTGGTGVAVDLSKVTAAAKLGAEQAIAASAMKAADALKVTK